MFNKIITKTKVEVDNLTGATEKLIASVEGINYNGSRYIAYVQYNTESGTFIRAVEREFTVEMANAIESAVTIDQGTVSEELSSLVSNALKFEVAKKNPDTDKSPFNNAEWEDYIEPVVVEEVEEEVEV